MDVTRFDADTPADRRKLFADAVTAHRNRGSQFLTVEAEPPRETLEFGESTEDGADAENADGDADEDADEEPAVPPWVQFAEKTFNLDCTDEELDRLHALLDDYPEFRVDARESPEEAEGTNVRISARSDANRLADFLDHVFTDVYDRDEDYRAWVTQI